MMPRLPFTHILLGQTVAVAISGGHIHVLNVESGELIHAVEVNASNLKYAALDPSGSHLVTAGDGKKLCVWRINGLELLSEREMPKKPTAVLFLKDSSTILVSDKFGDIFSYPLTSAPPAHEDTVDDLTPSQRAVSTSHKNDAGGNLVLGHASLLITFALTPDEQYIVSADRDEHVRISWFPKGYVIERFCHGHTKFVSAVHLPPAPAPPGELVTGGGDGLLKWWDWMSGEVLKEMKVDEVVMPFVQVSPPSKVKEDDDEGGTRSHRQRRRRRKESKQKGKEPQQEAAEVVVEADDLEADNEENASQVSESPGKLFAVKKIDSLSVGGAHLLLFSAVGATSLFWIPYASQSPSDVQYRDFSRPVLDFVVHPRGEVWVSIDADHPLPVGDDKVKDLVHVLAWTGLAFAPLDSSARPAVATSLNTECVHGGTNEGMVLDLYEPLSSWPKNVDGDDTQEADPRATSNKHIARNRKRALIYGETDKPNEDEEGDERETKRTRSKGRVDSSNDTEAMGEDR